MNQELPLSYRRVQYMESCFDMLRLAFETDPSLCTDPVFRACLNILQQYYHGELWLKDYQLDEAGFFPRILKRGVLSQDGVYNFLVSLEKMI